MGKKDEFETRNYLASSMIKQTDRKKSQMVVHSTLIALLWINWMVDILEAKHNDGISKTERYEQCFEWTLDILSIYFTQRTNYINVICHCWPPLFNTFVFTVEKKCENEVKEKKNS